MDTLEVYDSVNKNRLLGTIKAPNSIPGCRYEVAVMEPMDLGDYVADTLSGRLTSPPTQKVTFNVERRSKSDAEQVTAFRRRIVTEEWTVLETSASLDTLMKLEHFYLPGESKREAQKRRYFSDY